MNKKFAAICLAATTCFSMSSCNKSENKEIESNYTFTELSKIDLEVGETYNIRVMLDQTLSSGLTIKFASSNSKVLTITKENKDVIKAKKVGTAQLQILSNDGKKQAIPVRVVDDPEFDAYFNMDKGRLYGKNVVFYGDSITSYETWEGEYVTKLKEYYNFNHKNLSSWGTCINYSSRYTENNPRYTKDTTGVGFIYNNEEHNKWADYAFVFYGTNDRDDNTPIGVKDSEMHTSYDDTNGTFKGAINFAIKTLKEQNPNLRIIFLGMINNGNAESTQAYDNAISRQCGYNLVKYIKMFDLWSESEKTTNLKDSLHPNSNGYTKIYERIINS